MASGDITTANTQAPGDIDSGTDGQNNYAPYFFDTTTAEPSPAGGFLFHTHIWANPEKDSYLRTLQAECLFPDGYNATLGFWTTDVYEDGIEGNDRNNFTCDASVNVPPIGARYIGLTCTFQAAAVAGVTRLGVFTITLSDDVDLSGLVGGGVGVACDVVAMESDSIAAIGAPGNVRSKIIDTPSVAAEAQVYNGDNPPVNGFEPTIAPTAAPSEHDYAACRPSKGRLHES